MPTSATGRSEPRGAERGFTLIELLVVLAIVGVLSVVVSLSMTPDPRREASTEASRLALLLESAVQEAQWRGRAIAWSADAAGYRFWHADDPMRWQPIVEDEIFRPRPLADGINVAEVEVDGQQLPLGELLSFAPTTMPLFRITLHAEQGALILRSLPNGKVELQEPTSR